jgi:hypothetical protein
MIRENGTDDEIRLYHVGSIIADHIKKITNIKNIMDIKNVDV